MNIGDRIYELTIRVRYFFIIKRRSDIIVYLTIFCDRNILRYHAFKLTYWSVGSKCKMVYKYTYRISWRQNLEYRSIYWYIGRYLKHCKKLGVNKSYGVKSYPKRIFEKKIEVVFVLQGISCANCTNFFLYILQLIVGG